MDTDTQSSLTSLSETDVETSDRTASKADSEVSSETEDIENYGFECQSDGERSPEVIVLSEDIDIN